MTEAVEKPWPSGRVAWWAVVVLTLTYIVSFIDRTIVSLLTEPIKADLGLNDTQLSLLQGVAFGLFYSIMGLPLGWLADKVSRKKVIIVGVTVWCLATAACGAAQNFWQLFVARMGVGAGEASFSPAAVSIIADNFPPERRSLPLGLYASAAAGGSGAALVLGGVVIAAVSGAPRLSLPLLGEIAVWQAVFIIVGLSGLVCALLMMTVREPERRHAIPTGGADEAAPDTLIGAMRRNPRYFVGVLGAATVLTCLTYAVLSWVPAAFIRAHQWTPLQIGSSYGLVLLIFGPIGAVGGGWLSDVLKRRGVTGAPFWVGGGAMALVGPLVALAMMAPTGALSVALFAPAFVLFLAPGGILVAAVQDGVGGAVRARAAAVYYLVIGVVGMFVGPLSVAALTDYVFADPAALPISIAVVAVLFSITASALMLYARPAAPSGVLRPKSP
ncbi:spinster family MFS transporter [Brevundimonas staleyi]|uniref:Spinster family MFS transporter n=1 Tax=Brevundimonas staleyi TaxID=74326 RepID=A0ABW0FMI2_9CAUL